MSPSREYLLFLLQFDGRSPVEKPTEIVAARKLATSRYKTNRRSMDIYFFFFREIKILNSETGESGRIIARATIKREMRSFTVHWWKQVKETLIFTRVFRFCHVH